jgi:hypothetical protein
MFLNREALLSEKTLFKVKHLVIQMGDNEKLEMYIRQLSMQDYLDIQKVIADSEKKDAKEVNSFELPIRLIIASICDDRGIPLFASADREKVMQILPMGVLMKLANAITDFNNLGADAPTVESEIKNSTGTPNEGSYSVFVAN